MGGGCLTFTTASAAATSPLKLFHHNSIKQFHNNSLPKNTTQFKQRRNLSVKASTQNFSNGNSSISSNWDASSISKAPSWLPSFEELDTTTMLLRQRIVFLGTQLDDASADFLISQLLLLDAEDPQKDIKLFINCPGGAVTAAMALYDGMKMCKADVSTICMGLAASMGAFILASGTKGKRFCMPNGRVIVNEFDGTAGGSPTDFIIRVREMNYQKNKLDKIYSQITGKPVEQIVEDTMLGNCMNAWQAKDYGLVDAVIDDGKPGLVAPIADASPPPKSQVWYLWNSKAGNDKFDFVPSEEKLLEEGYVPPGPDEEDKMREQYLTY